MDKAKRSSAVSRLSTASGTNQRQSSSTEERRSGRTIGKKPEEKPNITSAPSSRPTGKKPEAKASTTTAPSRRPTVKKPEAKGKTTGASSSRPAGKKPDAKANTTTTPSSRPTGKKPEAKASKTTAPTNRHTAKKPEEKPSTTSAPPSSRLDIFGSVFGRPSASSTTSGNNPNKGIVAKKAYESTTAVSKSEAATAEVVERNEESQPVDAGDCKNTSKTVTLTKEQTREEPTEDKAPASSSSTKQTTKSTSGRPLVMETEAQAPQFSPAEAQVFWKGVRQTLSIADEEIASAVRPETPIAKITEVKSNKLMTVSEQMKEYIESKKKALEKKRDIVELPKGDRAHSPRSGTDSGEWEDVGHFDE